MTWAEPEYRKRRLRFWKLEKQIESLLRTYRAVKEAGRCRPVVSLETQWNTWISPGMAELKEKLSAREAEAAENRSGSAPEGTRNMTHG
ncbi:hypothetical protein ACYTVO_00960 (plasmid) [Escherichia coli]